MSKTVKLKSTPTAADCKQWFDNPTVNPLTKRRIDVNGPTYTALSLECEKYRDPSHIWMFFQSYNGAAKDKIHLIEGLSHPDVSLTEPYGPARQYLPFIAINAPDASGALMILDEVAKQRLSESEYMTLYCRTHEDKTLMDMLMSRPSTLKTLVEILPIDVFVALSLLKPDNRNNSYPLAHLMRHNLYDVVEVIVRKKPNYPESHLSNAIQWAGVRGQIHIFESLVKLSNVDPNARDGTYGNTPLLYALQAGFLDKTNIIDAFIKYGASIYQSSMITIVGERNNNFNIFTANILVNKAHLCNIISRHIDVRYKSPRIQITSDDVYNVMTLGMKQCNLRTYDGIDEYAKQAYLYCGIRYKDDDFPLTQETKDFIGKPSSWWLRDETLNNLKVRIVASASAIKQNSSRKKRTIYEIYLHHEGIGFVGIIGNFIKVVPPELMNVPELMDHGLLEKALQRLHDKRQLLLPVFPYQSRLSLFLFDRRLIDEVKLGYPYADHSPLLDIDSKTYMDLLISVQSAMKKERFVPQSTVNIVKRTYSKSFKSILETTAKKYEPPSIAQEITKTLLKTSPSKSAPSASGSQSERNVIVTREKSKLLERKISAQKKIAKFVKKRVDKLTNYFEDSIRYMNALPLEKRRTIYRALNGTIMQGPYSSIKRVNGLLYAKVDNMVDLLGMLEVVARAPTLPIRYSLYRGMAVEPPPEIGKTSIYQEIPFSTTFLSMYALGWVMAKKNSNCCLFELHCHHGTKGLFLSKLPWMDPWTSANSAIFNRIAPENARAKFHIKANAQNEFLMFPYKLNVVGKRSRNFKTLLDEQLEKIDSHYEFDASQRNLTSLFENNADLLDKTVDIYTIELNPISLYMVDLSSADVQTRKLFEPSKLLTDGAQPAIYDKHEYVSLFYSPEEIGKDVAKRIKALAINSRLQVVPIIKKGRYVGPKTFTLDP